MTKNELIRRVSQKAGCKRSDAEQIIAALDALFAEALKEDEKITFQNFGTFQVRSRAARVGRNPHSGDPLLIPESKTIVFKPGKNLKNTVCNK